MMTRLLTAVSFLTRVPLRRPFQGEDVARATIFFPLVGAGIGLVQLGLFRILAPRLPALVTAVLVVAVSCWVTRSLHLDGLIDFADGLGGGSAREDALAIMRDPRAGSFGVVAVVLVLAIKIAVIDSIGSIGPIGRMDSRAAPVLVLVVAPALARWTSVPLSFFCAYAREGGGLGSALTEHVGVVELLGATLLSAALVLGVGPRLGLVSWAAVLLATVATGTISRSRLGGITGDVLGANVELAEAGALVAAVITC